MNYGSDELDEFIKENMESPTFVAAYEAAQRKYVINKVLYETDPMGIKSGCTNEYESESEDLAKRSNGRSLTFFDLKECFDHWFWVDAIDTKTARELADRCNEEINK